MARRTNVPGSSEAVLRHWREAVPNDRLAHLIKDASKATGRALQARLAEHGVAFGHWVFLRILWVRDGLTQRELSVEAGLMEPTTFAALVAMEKLGYIERRRLPHSRKNMYVFLTDEGAALKGVLVPLAEDVNEVMVRDIAVEDVALTRRVLLTIIENLAADDLERTGNKDDGKNEVKSQGKLNRAEHGRSRSNTPVSAAALDS